MSSVQEKEIKMATTASTTLGYANNITTTNRDSSNSSSSQNQTSSDHHQSHTPRLVFNNNPPPPQNFVYTPPPSTTAPTDPDLRTVTAVPSTAPRIWYRECLRNHAATMGSHVVDGCGEFMPSGDENTPESLKCAACECHRNFHRKEVQRWGEQHSQSQSQSQQHHLQYFPTISLPHVSSSRGPVVAQPPLMMAFGGPAADQSSSEDLNVVVADAQPQPQKKKKKKRFRTKFSQEQKDKMVELAEKLGWRIQKHDEQEVQQFCSQLGINRQVFKVWMHNNKQPAAGTTKKQQL